MIHVRAGHKIETNEIVVNLAHRAAKMVSKTAAGKEYHILEGRKQ